ncbi:putative EMP1-like protein, partial [Plasmodium gaboni]
MDGRSCASDINKISDKNKLLNEWIIAAKLEGKKLKYQHNGDTNKLKKALGYSYADYGDLIKGTSIWGNTNTENVETNLQNLFKTIFQNHIKENTKTSGSNKDGNDLKLLREAWWNTNKKYIWGALHYGATEQINRPVFEQPNTDYIPQFLRFAQEWIEHF